MTDQFDWIREAGRLTWKTRDGVVRTLADMDCGHLHNVRKMLLRRRQMYLEKANACAGYTGNGDMASMEAEHSMSQAFGDAETIRDFAAMIRRYVSYREQHGFIVEGPK